MAFRLGPGAMVAAAFIGPGTLTTATMTGASSGLALAWSLLFALIATVVLQELAMRSALATQQDLAALARQFGGHIWGRWLIAPLIVLAIGIGNAAYQSGNLTGAAIGLATFFPEGSASIILCLSAIAVILILSDRYQWVERSLVVLVVLMALLFLGLALVLLPNLLMLPAERFTPRFNQGDTLLVLALIGTTIVPYNLFLHATAARRRWRNASLHAALQEARWESFIAIAIGAFITLAIIAVATVLLEAPSDLPILESLIHKVEQRLPGVGGALVATGLFAAGCSSALAAPIAAGWPAARARAARGAGAARRRARRGRRRPRGKCSTWAVRLDLAPPALFQMSSNARRPAPPALLRRLRSTAPGRRALCRHRCPCVASERGAPFHPFPRRAWLRSRSSCNLRFCPRRSTGTNSTVFHNRRTRGRCRRPVI